MNPSPVLIALLACEPSGDTLGAHLMAAIRQRCPAARFIGVGGAQMQAQGLQSLVPISELAVMGISEVLRRLPSLLRLRTRITHTLLEARPAVFVGIDAPDFNLGVALRMKAAGIPTVHYVSPTIWAWRPKRIHKIARAIDTVLCLFPFEPALYAKTSVAAHFIGHPLADAAPLTFDRAELRREMNLPTHLTVIALLPGSRRQEIERHTPIYLDTARLLHREFPDTQFLVPLVTREAHQYFERQRYLRKADDLPIRQMYGHAQRAMQVAHVSLIASGTATLEGLFAKNPMVVTYHMSPISYRMIKRRLLLPYISQPNILAGRFIVPELIQEAGSPENLAQALGNYLRFPALGHDLEKVLTRLHEGLRHNASQQAAERVLERAACSTI